MQNRIEINGVWYIKEASSNKQQEREKDIELDYSVEAIYEDDKYVFQATRFSKNKELTEFYSEPVISFTDKRIQPWQPETWDNCTWMRAVLKGESVAIKALQMVLCSEGVKTFKAFLRKLRELQWLADE